jgi:hypothetical protein
MTSRASVTAAPGSGALLQHDCGILPRIRQLSGNLARSESNQEALRWLSLRGGAEIGDVMNNPNQQNPGQQQGGQDKPGQQQGGGGQQKPGQQQQEPGKGGQGGQRQGGQE